MLRDLRKEFS